jgi:hypothetical protein
MYAFAGQVLSMLIDLISSYFRNESEMVAVNQDLIVCKDYRKFDSKGKLDYDSNNLPKKEKHPHFYVFDSNLTQVSSSSGKAFVWSKDEDLAEAEKSQKNEWAYDEYAKHYKLKSGDSVYQDKFDKQLKDMPIRVEDKL